MTKLSGAQLSVSDGQTLSFPALTALTSASLSASGATAVFGFPAVRQLTDVSLCATNGAVIAFPGATNYVDTMWGETIRASGVGSRIDLSHLLGFQGGDYSATAIQALNGGEVDLGGVVSGSTVCTWDGVGSLISLGKVTTLNGVQLLASNGGTLVISPTDHITWAGANSISGSGVGSRVINQGTLAATASGCTITITETNFTNVGELVAANGGVIDINSTVTVNDPGILAGMVSGTITIAGNLLGNTRNANQYAPLSEVRFDGAGSNAAPQLLEVMGRDLGATNGGFNQNFVYNTLSLANKTYVRLVDLSDNAPGSNAEALYVNSLIVPSGTTLDVNGLHVYARATQISGTILGGTVNQVADSGPIALGSSTPGTISLAGELDEWTFYGRAGREVTVVVNPGSSGSPAPLPPYLNWAMVRLLDDTTNVLATATNSSAGQVLTINDITLPADGTYRVQVRAAPQHSSSTGNYLVTVWDVTANVAALPLNQQRNGNIETPYAVDRWTFSAVAGQQIRFHLIMVSGPGVAFDLHRDSAPPGEDLFQNLTGNSDLFTLANWGGYTLTAHGMGGLYGTAYAFSMDETLQTSLPSGNTFNGTFSGSAQAQIFYVNLTNSGPLQMALNGIPAGSRIELYAKLGAPPTRADYDYSSLNPSAGTLQLLVSLAPAGTWYFLVYADYVPVSGAYTLAPTSSSLILTAETPDRHGNNVDATLTLTGAGFDAATLVELVASNGTAYAASSVGVDSFTQITATFAANTIPAGTYTVRVRRAGGDSSALPNALQVISGGQARLVTNLIVPSTVGRHAPATIYIEYANQGTVAMPAPLLVLTGTQRPILTVIRMGLMFTEGFWTSAMPSGFSTNIQILASGSTPGVLQPGEAISVPVAYAGLLQPWDFSQNQVQFNLGVLTADNTTAVDWASLKSGMRPDSIPADAWDVLWANFTAQVGATWGGYVQMLDDNAAYLGRLGQRVLDVGQLLVFEFQQADGLSPIRTLASAVDVADDAPGLSLSFARVFPEPISQRYQLGPLGRGWSHNWQMSLSVASDGTVTITGPAGSRRVFQPDSRYAGAYFSQPGDHGTLSALGGGAFSLQEKNGMLYAFRGDGKLDYVQDTNANRITCAYSGSQLTGLAHSAGQSLTVAYSAAGRIATITDSLSRQTTIAYDGSGEHLLSVVTYDGRTNTYAYFTGQGIVQEHALSQIGYAGGSHRYFTFDAQGRLASTYRDGNAETVTFSYDSAGTVTATDALSDASEFYFDHRGLLAKAKNALSNAVQLSFDNDYNLTQVTDPAGRSYSYEYDANGNLVRSTDALGKGTQFTYAPQFNRFASVTDANGNPTSYAYDAHGNLMSITYANKSRETWSYDSLGNPTAWTNRRGHPINFSHDANGRITRKTYQDGSHVDYTYDAHGNLVQTVDPTGTNTFTYSATDYLTRIDYPGGQWLQFTYDSAGRRATSLDQAGHQIAYTYDAAGRLQSLTNELGVAIVQYQYNPAGRLNRKTVGNGVHTTYDYDAAGQLLNLINYNADNSVLSHFSYTYDDRGRRTAMNTSYGQWAYAYDDIGQLTHAVLASSDTNIPNQDLAYLYDPLGNRVQTIENGTNTAYTVNNLNQYTQAGNTAYTFDEDGNLISAVSPTNKTTYTYSDDNQLLTVTTSTNTSQYAYDALGNRVATTENGVTTRYVIDPIGLGNLVGEYDGAGNLVAHYDHGFGLLSRATLAGSPAYYTFDAIANVEQLITAAGVVADAYAYSPFGTSLRRTETMPNPFQFVGKLGVMDDATGLKYMRARCFASSFGRFVSPDPMSLGGGDINLHRYCWNNPNNNCDPSGQAMTGWNPLGGKGPHLHTPILDPTDINPAHEQIFFDKPHVDTDGRLGEPGATWSNIGFGPQGLFSEPLDKYPSYYDWSGEYDDDRMWQAVLNVGPPWLFYLGVGNNCQDWVQSVLGEYDTLTPVPPTTSLVSGGSGIPLVQDPTTRSVHPASARTATFPPAGFCHIGLISRTRRMPQARRSSSR